MAARTPSWSSHHQTTSCSSSSTRSGSSSRRCKKAYTVVQSLDARCSMCQLRSGAAYEVSRRSARCALPSDLELYRMCEEIGFRVQARDGIAAFAYAFPRVVALAEQIRFDVHQSFSLSSRTIVCTCVNSQTNALLRITLYARTTLTGSRCMAAACAALTSRTGAARRCASYYLCNPIT